MVVVVSKDNLVWESLCPLIPNTVTRLCWCAKLLTGFWDLNSGPQGYVASTYTLRQISRPQIRFGCFLYSEWTMRWEVSEPPQSASWKPNHPRKPPAQLLYFIEVENKTLPSHVSNNKGRPSKVLCTKSYILETHGQHSLCDFVCTCYMSPSSQRHCLLSCSFFNDNWSIVL